MDLRMIPVMITLCFPLIYLVLTHIQNIKDNRDTRAMLSKLVDEKKELIKKIEKLEAKIKRLKNENKN